MRGGGEGEDGGWVGGGWEGGGRMGGGLGEGWGEVTVNPIIVLT